MNQPHIKVDYAVNKMGKSASKYNKQLGRANEKCRDTKDKKPTIIEGSFKTVKMIATIQDWMVLKHI